MKNNNQGQILVESIVAVSIGVLAITGVLSLLTSSLGVNRDVAQRLTATYLASEGVEITKSLIDKNYVRGEAWNAGLSDGSYEFVYNVSDGASSKIGGEESTRKLYFNLSNGVYNYDNSEVETNFIRTVKLANVSIGSEIARIEVSSNVKWIERGGSNKEITIEDHFYRWRPNLSE